MKFKPILKTKYVNFGALYECPVCHKTISTPHDGTPNFCCECGIAFEWESDIEKRQNFAKQILDYWDKRGTEQTILFLKDIAETDDEYYRHSKSNSNLIPSISHIRALYNEIVPLLKELKTKADVIEFGEKHNVTMEINYDFAEKFDESQAIEVIRCEVWGNLSYIDVYPNDSVPRFDVWCEFRECDFINGTTIENLEKDYIQGIKWLWATSKTSKLNELIETLRLHGITYNDMTTIYGFEPKCVARHKSRY